VFHDERRRPAREGVSKELAICRRGPVGRAARKGPPHEEADEAFIKQTDTDGGWKVDVTGKIAGEKMTVESISLQAQ
jgi:hypothetical protein